MVNLGHSIVEIFNPNQLLIRFKPNMSIDLVSTFKYCRVLVALCYLLVILIYEYTVPLSQDL